MVLFPFAWRWRPESCRHGTLAALAADPAAGASGSARLRARRWLIVNGEDPVDRNQAQTVGICSAYGIWGASAGHLDLVDVRMGFLQGPYTAGTDHGRRI